MSASMEPEELVAMLNHIFTRFDALADRHGLEKIKTIGDAYMVAGGVPEPRTDHAVAVCRMALEMMSEIEILRGSISRELSLRIGIDSGPAVAGVIGRRKFIYDLWGDTVNTASRMESHGSPGTIHVTERTYHLAQDLYEFSEPSTLEVKGKGRMTTYTLLGSKAARMSGVVP
jgi:class 3 adenylate cyclase